MGFFTESRGRWACDSCGDAGGDEGHRRGRAGPGRGARRAGRRGGGPHRAASARRRRRPAGRSRRGDVAAWLPEPPADSHKYRAGVAMVAGSPGMMGAAQLCARAAMRAGAGYVRLGSPGVHAEDLPIGEHVGRSLPYMDWDAEVLDDIDRYKALVVGPGLGRDDYTSAEIRTLLAEAGVPALVDGDGLYALGGVDEAAPVLSRRSRPTVLTPHEGEFRTLAGKAPDADRLGSVRSLA